MKKTIKEIKSEIKYWQESYNKLMQNLELATDEYDLYCDYRDMAEYCLRIHILKKIIEKIIGNSKKE